MENHLPEAEIEEWSYFRPSSLLLLKIAQEKMEKNQPVPVFFPPILFEPPSRLVDQKRRREEDIEAFLRWYDGTYQSYSSSLVKAVVDSDSFFDINDDL